MILHIHFVSIHLEQEEIVLIVYLSNICSKVLVTEYFISF